MRFSKTFTAREAKLFMIAAIGIASLFLQNDESGSAQASVKPQKELTRNEEPVVSVSEEVLPLNVVNVTESAPEMKDEASLVDQAFVDAYFVFQQARASRADESTLESLQGQCHIARSKALQLQLEIHELTCN